MWGGGEAPSGNSNCTERHEHGKRERERERGGGGDEGRYRGGSIYK